MNPDLWMHQSRCISEITDALAAGHRRVCLQLPTGGGKTRIACELVRDWLECGFRVSLYTNRRMLLDQLARVLSNFGLTHGRRSADAIEHGELPTDDPLQISSIQTEASRTLKKKVWQLHDADRIIIDECHLQKEKTAQEILRRHLEKPGSAYLGLTATPLDIGGLYDHLIVGATLRELRDCGALVRADHYGWEEPDTGKIKKPAVEMSENEVRKLCNVRHLVGHVLNHFKEMNPDGRPTIGFAPGVGESIWLAEQCEAAGIPSAHIDGQSVILRGLEMPSNRDSREHVMKLWRAGEVKVVWNRFVLREGIDAPWIEHMILATIFNSLQSYLQSVGRGLRASPGKTRLSIADHGGNWWRWGSVNHDRQWSLEMTERMAHGIRDESLRSGNEQEPARCPKCGQITLLGKCHACGFKFSTRVCPVITVEGDLKEHRGTRYRSRPRQNRPDTKALWTKMYFRSKSTDRTFRAALGLFFHENGYYPPASMPFMPKTEWDLVRRVKDVPRERLT